MRAGADAPRAVVARLRPAELLLQECLTAAGWKRDRTWIVTFNSLTPTQERETMCGDSRRLSRFEGHHVMARRLGFSLVELLVVLAILGILLALLMPSIQFARELARRSSCQNNLKQLGLAARQCVDTTQYFPTGGWGHGWSGEPTRGNGARQPGGWIYNLLPYIEKRSLYEMAGGDRLESAGRLAATPIDILNCPTRRSAIRSPYPVYPGVGIYPAYNAKLGDFVARADYAISCGDVGVNNLGPAGGPSSLTAGDSTYKWVSNRNYTGVSFFRSEIGLTHVEADGTTNTYLIGEKYLNPEMYATGADPSDYGHMYAGFARETVRMARVDCPPAMDRLPVSNTLRFGSAHSGGCYFVFCDGSVRLVAYSITPEIHRRLGNRSDSGVVTTGD